MSLAPAQALSLDLDGTLYKVRRLRVAWRLRKKRGLMLALLAAREKLRHEEPPMSGEVLHRREAELVAPSFELSLEQAQAELEELRQAMPEALTRGVRSYPGVRGALEAAHSQGLKLAVLSDFDPDEKLRFLGLDDLPWSARLSAEQLGALKPHQHAYEQVCQAVGAPAEQVVHIGDREDLDVAGALGAGLRAWRFSRGNSGVSTAAEHTFDRWRIDLFAPLYPTSSH